MVAAVILAIVVPLLFQTFTGAIHIQSRRAVQEEALIFASDYLERTKLRILNPNENVTPFDSIRVFRSDTLLLKRSVQGEITNSIATEQFSVVVDSRPILTISHKIPEKFVGSR